MSQLSSLSLTILYVVVGLISIYILLLWILQIKVWRGGTIKNPDGSIDDWHEHNLIYGIALADVFLSCPAGIVGAVLIFLQVKIGLYLFAMVSFFYVWANIATTATSLRFYKPKINFLWFISFPFGTLLGMIYLIWTLIYFDMIF